MEEIMSALLSLAHIKNLIFTSARRAIIECFEQKSDTIFQENPLQGFRLDGVGGLGGSGGWRKE